MHCIERRCFDFRGESCCGRPSPKSVKHSCTFLFQLRVTQSSERPCFSAIHLRLVKSAPASLSWRKATHIIRSITRCEESPIFSAISQLNSTFYSSFDSAFYRAFRRYIALQADFSRYCSRPLRKGYVPPCRLPANVGRHLK